MRWGTISHAGHTIIILHVHSRIVQTRLTRVSHTHINIVKRRCELLLTLLIIYNHCVTVSCGSPASVFLQRKQLPTCLLTFSLNFLFGLQRRSLSWLV